MCWEGLEKLAIFSSPCLARTNRTFGLHHQNQPECQAPLDTEQHKHTQFFDIIQEPTLSISGGTFFVEALTGSGAGSQ